LDREDIHILRLMGEIGRDGSPSQRELSVRLNLSLGLVNTFTKRLVNKGYFKVKTMPRNRVKYFLTPKGLARKSRLTVEYLRYSVNFYKEVKGLLLSRYEAMQKEKKRVVLFYGAGEIAELAYLYLQLTDLQLAGVVDEFGGGSDFFGLKVEGVNRLWRSDWDAVLLTRLDRIEEDLQRLIGVGVPLERIVTL
jgi:DNA-binding MarR family transcriptional regulator